MKISGIVPFLTLSVLGALATACDPASAQQFSADLVTSAKLPGRLYVADGKARIETPEFSDGFFLVDGDTGSAFFVRPAQRVFMEARQSTWLSRLLVPLGPDDPCERWQAMAERAGAAVPDMRWHCDRLGNETVEGRELVKYRVVSPRQRLRDAWIAPDLRFPVRLEAEDGATATLKNIKEGPQPADLFAIPAGYRKFDPQALIDRIKQSDVWVEPPR